MKSTSCTAPLTSSDGRHDVKTRHIVAFLVELIENVDRVFEAKLLFAALLDALCKGRQQCEFESVGVLGDAERQNAYFTSEELQVIEGHYAAVDRRSCAHTYALRCMLTAVVPASTARKRELFSSVDSSHKPETCFCRSVAVA